MERFAKIAGFAGFARFAGFGVSRSVSNDEHSANLETPATPANPRTPDLRSAYSLWSATYPASAHNPLMRLEQDVVGSILTKLRPTRALDVGTGSGRYLPVLAATGAACVIGVDFSMAMLRRSLGGKVVCADAFRLPVRRAAFDVVNASLMVGDIQDLPSWTREMARVLARGGHLVYSDFHPSWAQHGWKRTFRDADGHAHDIGFVPHAIDEHLGAIAAAGLRVRAIREPRFADEESPDVQAFRRRWRNPPVVVVLHATKDT